MLHGRRPGAGVGGRSGSASEEDESERNEKAHSVHKYSRAIIAPMRCLALLCFALLLAPAARPAGAEDEKAIRALVASYVAARQERDPAAIEKLFTPDADQLVSSGEWRFGRPALVKGMLGSSSRRPGSRRIGVDRVRFLTEDVALADGPYVIGGTGDQPERRMWTSFTAQRVEGVWRIAAIRNMKPAE